MADYTSSMIEHLKLPKGPNLNIILTGITGDGKSATGNSIILKKDHFVSKAGWDSATEEYLPGCNEIDNRCIFVADTPGLDDTHELDDKSQQNLVIDAVTESITACPQGYDAILLVVSSKSRFRNADQKVIKKWIKIVGENEFKSHGVLVLTHGDIMGIEDGYDLKKTLGKWWKTQAGKNDFLLKACSNRCVIFSNETEDLQMKRQQLYDLVTCIDEMKNKGRCIPKLCQFSETDVDKANFEYAVQISEFTNLFHLLKTKIESLKTESDAQRRVIIKRLTKDLEHLKKQLMQEKNKSIYDCIHENVRELGNDFDTIRRLADFPKNEGMVINNICGRIDNIVSRLDEERKNTLYWQSVRNNTVVFFRDIFPMALATGALAVGGALLVAEATILLGPALLAGGAVAGVVGAINITARNWGKEKGDKDINDDKKD